MLLIIYVLIFLILLGVTFYFAVLSDSIFGKEDFATSSFATNQIVQIIKDRKLDNGIFFDLGSCRGEFASQIAKACPNLKVLGIDDSWLRTWLARRRSVFLKNLTFKRENIFAIDVSSADIVYVYLPRELLPKLQAKLQKELKRGATVITNCVSFPSWQPEEHNGEIFVYKQA